MRSGSRVLTATLLGTWALWGFVAAPEAPAAEEPTACTANGTALQITAEHDRFDKDCMAVPPEQSFTIELDNKDLAIGHNVSIYDTANGKKALYKGRIVYGPGSITYTVSAQAKGTYVFTCDPHTDRMRGTFIVS